MQVKPFHAFVSAEDETIEAENQQECLLLAEQNPNDSKYRKWIKRTFLVIEDD